MLEFTLDDPDDFYAEVVSPPCHTSLQHIVMAEAARELAKEHRLHDTAWAMTDEQWVLDHSAPIHPNVWKIAARQLEAFAEGWRQGVLDEMEGE